MTLMKALVRKEEDANWTQLFFGGNDSKPPPAGEQSSRLRDPEVSINSMDSTAEVPDQVSS